MHYKKVMNYNNLWCIIKKTGTQNLQTGTVNPKQEATFFADLLVVSFSHCSELERQKRKLRAIIHQCCHIIICIRKLSYLVLKPKRQKKAHRQRFPFYESLVSRSKFLKSCYSEMKFRKLSALINSTGGWIWYCGILISGGNVRNFMIWN